MTEKTTQTQLTVAETENAFTTGAASWDSNFRDRLDYDRQKILTQAITAWRTNPMARRIIELTTEFVLGDGISFHAHAGADKVLREFWNDPLNAIDEQLPEWADEAWRTGDLFLLCSTDGGGRLYVRGMPSEQIGVIETAPNDYRQEMLYKRDAMDEHPWYAFDPSNPDQSTFVLHFPLNRAVGANFGESDLAPSLYWIGLYRQWLEDRGRLNYFRQLFSYTLQRPFSSDAEKEKYMRDFAAKLPKKSGSILGLDTNETLGVINPNLASFEAAEDGLALKRMIAIGAGIPMHYLAEPEESTRTTAEAAGTPTFKRFKRRQQFLANVIKTLLQVVVAVRRRTNNNLPAQPEIRILVPDISEKDNANLAIAVQRVVTAFAPLYNAKLIEPKEFIRLVYRFVAENIPEKTGEFAPVFVRGGGMGKIPNDPGSTDPNAL